MSKPVNTLAYPPVRCWRKSHCKLAWPDSCPAWGKWQCPVAKTERHQVPKEAKA